MLMNRYDIDDAVRRFGQGQYGEALQAAALSLKSLMDWTDQNSDGWPYWCKPKNASKTLQRLLYAAETNYRQGHTPHLSHADVRRALSPIKAFATRQAKLGRPGITLYEPCKTECGA